MDKKIVLTGQDLKIEDVLNVAEKGYQVDYSPEVRDKIKKFREALEKQLYENPNTGIYGVNRGCGDLKDAALKLKILKKYIKAMEKNVNRDNAFKQYLEALEDCQVRYIKAHNCGTGNPLPIEVVRAAMVIRLNSFAKGHSAVRLETCQLMIDMLNKGVTPWVLEEGSVGASGDLVPLAMIGAVMLGLPEAKAYYNGELMSAEDALTKAGLQKIKLGAKEAMALTNGSTFIAALAVFAVRDAERLLKNASISTALSLEAIRGEKAAFSELIANARPHKGHIKIARQVRNLLEGSKRTTIEAQKVRFPRQSKDTARERIQDRYSFRAVPQVHGAVYEAIENLKEVVEIEINSATDNPLFFQKNNEFKVLSGANFHGQPLAVVIDYLKIALTGLALITNKRIFSMLDKHQSYGLPKDLAVNPSEGDTGLMIAQYAAAARAAESRILSTPASIMSISTAANQEDFVSMGTIGALHLHKIIYNTQIIIAIELLCALRGLQMTYGLPKPLDLRQLGKGTSKIYEYLNRNELLPPVKEDQYLRDDIEKVINIVKSGKLIEEVKDLI